MKITKNKIDFASGDWTIKDATNGELTVVHNPSGETYTLTSDGITAPSVTAEEVDIGPNGERSLVYDGTLGSLVVVE